MEITTKEAEESIEVVFDFDHVADAMFAVRKDLESKEAQERLVSELVRCASEELEDTSPECLASLNAAAKARVDRFVAGSKYSQSGCSGL